MMAEMSSARIFQLNFVGDVMLGRLVDQLFPQHVDNPSEARIVASFLDGYPHLRNYSHRSPWGSALPLFHAADLNLINLETAVTTSNVLWPHKAFNYRMHPANVAALKEAKVDYAGLANNHTLDFGTEGLVETVWTLRNARIAFAGAGETTEEAFRPAVLSLPRAKRAGRADPAPAQRDEQSSSEGGTQTREEHPPSHTIHVYSASDHPADWAPVPTFHFIDYSHSSFIRLKSLLTTSPRSRPPGSPSPPSLKIFSVHWGPNYAWRPDESTIRSLAHYLIDECGVDIVHGHSSHHIQGVEKYRGKLIIYGCGDFIDDYALNREFRNDLGAVWRVVVRENEYASRDGDNGGQGGEREGEREKEKEKKKYGLELLRLEIFPTRCDKFQAMLLGREDRDHVWVREKVKALSRDLGTNVREELGEKGQVVVDLGE